MSVLTDLQRKAAELFFALDESEGFLIGGGIALLATGLTTRPTEDLDLFTAKSTTGVTAAGDAFESACAQQGWTIERIHDVDTFRRIKVDAAGQELLVDLAVDSPPLGTPIATGIGPTYPPEELAARKLLALFDRAAARDFVDVAAISETVELGDLVTKAREVDGGFDLDVLIQMLAGINRIEDEQLRQLGADPTAIRAFFRAWAEDLTNHPG